MEYAALAGLVSIALAGAAALTSGGLGTAVGDAVRRGICEVTSERCPVMRAASIPPDLEACPLRRDGNGQSVSVDVGVVRLAGQLGISVEQLSDGRVRISFADGGRAGAGAAVGAHLTVGGRSMRGEASVDAGIAVTSGRAWLLPNAAAAERFVSRYASSETFGGRALGGVAKICPLCGTLVGAPAEPPRPDERWISGGLAAGSNLGISQGPLGAQLESVLRGAVGRKRSRTSTTWLLRLDDTVAARLDAFGGGLDGELDGSALASLELDRDGNPLRLRLTVARGLSTRKGLRLPANLRALLGSSRSGAGQAIESDSLLELRDSRDRKAALGFLAAGRALDPAAALEAARKLREALDRRGVRTVRRFASRRSATGIGAGGALGVRLGLDADRTSTGERLVSVATKLPGLEWMARADCLPV